MIIIVGYFTVHQIMICSFNILVCSRPAMVERPRGAVHMRLHGSSKLNMSHCWAKTRQASVV